MKTNLIILSSILFSMASMTANAGDSHASAKTSDTCGLESQDYVVQGSSGGEHATVDSTVSIEVNTEEGATWELTGENLTASGSFYTFSDDCSKVVLYGIASYPREECIHAITLYGDNDWEDIYATFIDTHLDKNCHEYDPETFDVNTTAADRIRLFGHNGQLHFVLPPEG